MISPINDEAVLALMSVVTVMAHESLMVRVLPVRTAAWYDKTTPTFADALGFVRGLFQRVTDRLAHAA
ncbi:MAG: hypothetical protein AVDCRST_MAG93-3650 [uncultured Chloroflexia bacterium]|uniref:Uncharacterized protein n=1 Tax=uncultured Chloroflexia bacterium TaxID=1672391 RepID=A0A6J4JU19_9CHLR|nr:MAG: hypothetical protein AVDCRST_MAG93-3650 [uncultured Chloroflexia bacterium]